MMVWLPEGGKKFEDMFIRFNRIHERDRQTDTRTDHMQLSHKRSHLLTYDDHESCLGLFG